MSKTNNESKMTLKKAFSINSRALGILFKHYPGLVVSQIFLAFWNAVTPYVEIFLVARIVDELVSHQDIQRIQSLVIITLVTAAVIALVTAILNKWCNSQNAGRYLKLEHIYAEKSYETDYVNLDNTRTGELLSQIRQNTNGGGWGIIRALMATERVVTGLVTILSGIGLTVSLFVAKVPSSAGALALLNNPLVTIGFIVAMLAVVFISAGLGNTVGGCFAKYAKQHTLANRLFGFFGWMGYDGRLATDMRIYCQHKICEYYNTNKEDTFASKGFFAKLARGTMGFFAASSAAFSVLFTALVYAFVCLKALGGAFGLGYVTQYIASITKSIGGISGLVMSIGDIYNNATFVNMALEYLDLPNTMPRGSRPVPKGDVYNIEFQGVSFKYPGSDDFALRDVNMKFQVGKRLAVVGMNGSGKTTFIKLLCRLYDPTEGSILLDGVDIREYDYEQYQGIFSVVFQDFRLLSLPLGYNVASKTDYDRALVESCLEKADFGERLAKLSDGLETYLYNDYDKNGVEVSGGEAQKIAIARSLYKDAPFIILDEPTAALDPIAESEIYSKFDEIVGNKTAIYISHRLSSCKFCDEILVFDSGAVVQHGSHQALLADTAGKYSELWNAQAQYYVE